MAGCRCTVSGLSPIDLLPPLVACSSGFGILFIIGACQVVDDRMNKRVKVLTAISNLLDLFSIQQAYPTQV
jgi:hypothetical protein